MKRIILFFITSFYVLGLTAQVSLAWTKSIGTTMNTSVIDHKTSASGNLFVFGKTEDTICNYDAFFISKLNGSNGNELFQTVISTDSACNEESPAAFSVGSGNHILTCGQQPNNQAGALLYNIDATNLSVLWGKDTCSYYVDCVHGFSNEDYLVGNNPPELQRWSETGNFSWSYIWSGPVANATKVFTDNINGVYMLVNTFETVPSTFPSGFGLVKRDTINNMGWSMYFNPKPGEINSPINAVLDSFGNTYVLSKTITTTDSIFLNKISSSGQLLWTSSYGQTPYAYDLKYDQAHDDLLALVRVNGAIKIIRFDSSGALLDTTLEINTAFVTGSPVFDVDTFGDSYLSYVVPVSASNFTTYVNKYNFGGGVIWAYSNSRPKPLFPACISVESDGSVYTSFTINSPSTIADSIFVIKLDQPLSVSDVNNTINLSLFPNPTTLSFTYSIPSQSAQNNSYLLTDMQGRTVLSGKCNPSGKGEIDISSLSPSVYFISILNDSDEMITVPEKIIKL